MMLHGQLSDPEQTNILVKRAPKDLLLKLRLTVPQCSQHCLQAYLADYDCTPSNGISCLCQQYSSQGFTLGELAYLCLDQDCGQGDRSESLAQYNICSTVSGAVEATHSVLSAPVTTRTTIRTTSTLDPASTLQTTTSRANAGTDGSKTTTMAPSFARGAGSSTLSATSHASTVASGLTSNQTIGISISVVGLVVILVASAYYHFCFQRRKPKEKKQESKSDLALRKALREPSAYLTITPANDFRRVDRDTINCWQQLSNSSTLYNMKYNNTSHESTENLLPNKPEKAQVRHSAQLRAESNRTSAMMFEQNRPPTVPNWKSLGLPPNPRAVQHSPSNTMQPLQQAQRAHHPTMTPRTPNSALSLNTAKYGALPPALTGPMRFPVPPIPEADDCMYDTTRGSSVSRSRSRDSSVSVLNYYASSEAGLGSSPDLVDSPAGMAVQVPSRPEIPRDIVVTRHASSQQPVRKDSTASDTSFETNASEATTPPFEDNSPLTPVVESPPPQRSPVSDLRYPKIPRSANQAVPRSPPPRANFPRRFQSIEVQDQIGPSQNVQHEYLPKQTQQSAWPLPNRSTPERQINIEPNLSGTTLAAKRRGRGVAHGLELKLDDRQTAYTAFHKHKPGPPHRSPYPYEKERRTRQHESPLKGYGRVARGGRTSLDPRTPPRRSPGRYEPQEVTITSPLWEPKLTPQRRGDDLYLQVGIATPLQDTFQR